MSDPSHRPTAAAPPEDLLHAVLDVVGALVIILDPGGVVVAFNRACERLSGYSADEIVGTSLWETLIAPAELDSTRAAFQKLASGRFPATHENHWVRRDGSLRLIAWSNTSVLDGDGRVRWVIGTGLDVTDARRNATELALSEARYQRILETANDGVWITDTEGRTQFLNQRMADMLGCSRGEALERTVWDFVDPEWRAAGEAQAARRVQGKSDQFDFQFRRSDGSLLYAIVSTSPITDPQGRVIGGLGMVTDITDRKRIEERQRRLMAELDHRVKNALATVVALTEETSRSTSSVEAFRDTLGARIRLMARAHEALARGQWEGVHLDELAYEVLSPFAAEDRVRVSGPSVRLPPFVALPLALTLHELITNSVKHGSLSAAGGRVSLTWDLPDLDRVVIAWRESDGPPVPARILEGTGLGLVRDFVEYELAGKVELEFLPAGLACDLEVPLRTRGAPLSTATH